jgi:anhydro-N-acetylmuramic acid kinase
MLSIGLMSGTSMDGIDAALLETDGSQNSLKALGHTSIAYAPPFKMLLKAAEYSVRQSAGNMAQAENRFSDVLHSYLRQELKLPPEAEQKTIQELKSYLSDATQRETSLSLKAVIQHSTALHGLAVKQLLKETANDRKSIAVVGYHGQTLYHNPSVKTSIIVGNGQVLANDLGIKVVNDFRSQDVAAGGQGAPFAPLYHHALALRDQRIPAAIVNCGGIANITLIPSQEEHDLLAFDTGPGNGLIDQLVRQRTKGKENMDVNGRYGQQGQVNEEVLKALYEKALVKDGQNFLLKKTPKALDIGDLKLIPELATLSLEDACATLETFTAQTIVNSLSLVKTEFPRQWILAGGGWKNPVIRKCLEDELIKAAPYPVTVLLADEAGWNSQALEAEIFAYLAVRSLQGKALSLPGTTGVPKPLTGGCTYLPCLESSAE